MSKFDKIYKDIVMDIIQNGKMQKGDVRAKYADGTPAYTKYIHGVNFVIEPNTIPVLYSKRVAWKTALVEMEWIWQEMSSDVRWLNERGVKIWDEWRGKDHTIGHAYGFQLANKKRVVKITKENGTPEDIQFLEENGYSQMFKRMNQVEFIIHEIKNNPRSRRMLTTLWNVEDLEKMELEPCVYETQWEVDDDDYLILHVRQRSCDMALGSAFNLIQYSVLHRLMAKATGKKLGNMYWNIGNAHIYDRHLDLIEKQVNQDLSEIEEVEPTIVLPDGDDFFDMKLSDVKIENYKYLKGDFKYEVAI